MNHRIAVVGAGYFSQFQLQGWQEAGAPAQHLCDLDLARAQPLADRFGVPHVHSDVVQMLDAAEPTLLDVCLPPVAQAAVVRLALQRRIPTICQKPFGLDYAQAVELTALAHEQRTPLVIHENFRFTPWFRECRRLIDAGHFGRLHGVTFRLRPGDGQGPRAYLDRQPYFQQMPHLLVRETAVHFVDTFRYLMGDIVAVTARLRRLNPVIAGEDAGLLILEFDDDRCGLFDGNRLNDHAAENTRKTMGEMWLEGSAGVMRLDGDANLWWKPHGGVETAHGFDRGGAGAFGGACTLLQKHVLSHLEHGTPLENAAQDYLAIVAAEYAIYESHRTGRRIEMRGFEPGVRAPLWT